MRIRGGRSKGRRRALAAAAVGLGAAAVLVMAFPALREQWYIHRLGSDSYEDRKAACVSLGRWGTARAIPHLFERLVREATTDPPWDTVCSFEGVPFHESPARVYWWAILQIGLPAVPELSVELRKGATRARPWAADLLGTLSQREFARELEERGIHDLDGFEASGFLLQRGAPEAVQGLLAEVGAADEAVSREVCEALVGIGVREFAMPGLLHLLENGDTAARIGAADVLELIALDSDSPYSEEIASAMRKACADPSPDVRRLALTSRLHGLRTRAEAVESGLEGATGPSEAERREVEALFWSEFPSADLELRRTLLLLLDALRPWSETTTGRVRELIRDPELGENAREALQESGSDLADSDEPQPVELKVLPGFEDEPEEEDPGDDAVEPPPPDEDG